MEGATCSSCAPDGSRESVKCQVRQEACVPSWSNQLKKFWKFEQIGIEPESEKSDDTREYESFEETVEFVNGRYYVPWPWKEDQLDLLPENFELANGRLQSFVKRLTKTPEVLEKYNDTISQQLDMGVIEEVTEGMDESSAKHYIPHHCVVKPASNTTKVRVVYDASAKTKEGNPTLNECMHRGPILLPDLCEILLRSTSWFAHGG